MKAKFYKGNHKIKTGRMLGILLAAMMAFSPVANTYAASGDTATVLSETIKNDNETFKSDAVKICEAIGMLKGSGNGLTEEYLETATQRYQVAIMILRLKGLEEEAKNYTGGSQFEDLKDGGMWQEGLNMMSYMKDHPELGFSGYPDGTMRPYVEANGHVYYKVLLEILGYEIGVDYLWNKVEGNDLPDVMEMAQKLGWESLEDVYEIPEGTLNADGSEKVMEVNHIAEATVEALTSQLKNSRQTLAVSLGIDLDDIGSNDDSQYTNEDSIFNFDEYNSLSESEVEEQHEKGSLCNIIEDNFYTEGEERYSYLSSLSPTDRIIAGKAYMLFLDYHEGPLNNYFPENKNYEGNTWDALIEYQKYQQKQVFIDKNRYVSFQDQGDNVTPIVLLLMNEEWRAMFKDDITKKTEWTLDVGQGCIHTFVGTPAVEKDMSFYEGVYRDSTGEEELSSNRYVVYICQDENTYVVFDKQTGERVGSYVNSYEGNKTVMADDLEKLPEAVKNDLEVKSYNIKDLNKTKQVAATDMALTYAG